VWKDVNIHELFMTLLLFMHTG